MTAKTKKPSRAEVEYKAANAAKELEASKKAEPARRGYTLYVSSGVETAQYDIRANGAEVKGNRDRGGTHLCFRVPDECVDSFEQHVFFKSGRIIKAKVE